ncbi:hypothetical protein [Thetidibacter halocola]|uniref:Uncharacterized protein n=1 Tax=Thetidibacter halocola TaxID=2827239 RepID=A0A8J7WEL6_9RHOB|nr:hypothetical protein [Thetidibacter halocola]MBS0124964.1 hypothetical protein [Thetidibacter halocola]
MLSKILSDLNTTACFDFGYQPEDGDRLEIQIGEDHYRLSFSAWGDDPGEWVDDEGSWGDASDYKTAAEGGVLLS